MLVGRGASPARHRPEALRLAVTADVARNIDRSGRFILPELPPPPHDEISIATAVAQAAAYVGTYGHLFVKSYSAVHRREIDLDRLEVDPRVFYARSPYEIAAAEVHPPTRKAIGPFHLVSFTFEGAPAVSVAVSALNVDVRVEGERLELPPFRGGDFHSVGIWPGHRLPLSPEEAAIAAHRATGALVREVPVAHRDGLGGFVPNYALWRIPLDRTFTARLVHSSEKVETDVLFVGPRGLLFVGLEGHYRDSVIRLRDHTGAMLEVPLVIQAGEIARFAEVLVDAG